MLIIRGRSTDPTRTQVGQCGTVLQVLKQRGHAVSVPSEIDRHRTARLLQDRSHENRLFVRRKSPSARRPEPSDCTEDEESARRQRLLEDGE